MSDGVAGGGQGGWIVALRYLGCRTRAPDLRHASLLAHSYLGLAVQIGMTCDEETQTISDSFTYIAMPIHLANLAGFVAALDILSLPKRWRKEYKDALKILLRQHVASLGAKEASGPLGAATWDTLLQGPPDSGAGDKTTPDGTLQTKTHVPNARTTERADRGIDLLIAIKARDRVLDLARSRMATSANVGPKDQLPWITEDHGFDQARTILHQAMEDGRVDVVGCENLPTPIPALVTQS